VIAYFSRLRPAARTVIVAAGYVVTVALTALVLHVYVAVTNTPDRQTSSGMFAFGDSLVFLAVLGVAAVPATGAALYFLRSRRSSSRARHSSPSHSPSRRDWSVRVRDSSRGHAGTVEDSGRSAADALLPALGPVCPDSIRVSGS
jgi:hypothetical protein